MSIATLQQELKKLSPAEKLALADYLVIQAGESPPPSAAQDAELQERLREAVAHPERLLDPDEALRRLKR